MSRKRRISALFLYILKYKKYAIMGKEGEIMAYSRVEKYQELRDGIKEEAGISKEKKSMPVDVETDEDDDFLSFMKTDEHIEKEMSLEDTLTEAKTFEQMREEGSKELEEALKSAKRSVGKETEYNTRMDILSKIREPEKTTIKIDSVDEYKTEEFSKGMFLNEEYEQKDEPSIEKTAVKERKKMTFMERLASMSPEEDAKKAEEFLKNEELQKEQEIIEEKDDEFVEKDNYLIEEDEQIDSQKKKFESVQEEREDDNELQKETEKQDGKLVKVLNAIITILVIVFIVLLGVIIYQNFF